MRGKSLMVMGTASSVGKSVLCSAFLRIMKQDGYKVAPFKAQNMALNSFVTKDGLEMGRAQVTQAQAAGVEPDVRMNPVLLKPTSDRRSQVIVDGKAIGTMTAMEYHRYKPALRERIKATYDALESTVDCVVIEGAGSPAEINLRAGDIVNMSMAESADAPVLLVGDINLGGVFASLLGTVMLLTDEERARVKGVIINKFRGDVKILEPGLRMLEERIHIPVLGVVPWMDVGLEDEDSVTERFSRMMGQGDLDVAVVKLKHISNFTDFQSLSLQPGVKVRYAQSAKEIENADLIVLPGTKNTIEDLIDLRNRGFGTEKIEDDIKALFPDARVARMDLDTTRTRTAYERIISDFQQGKTDILIGTQMVSKGLDFDHVNIVGILNADTMLNYPDFRAYERAFQLMAQVAGRAGRKNKRGRVVLQTKSIDHPIIPQVIANDYEAMVGGQLAERQMFHYPPYYRLVYVYLKNRNETLLDLMAQTMAAKLRTVFGNRVLGPDKPPVARVQTLFIRKIVLKIETNAPMARARELLVQVQKEMVAEDRFKSLIVYYDVDPM